MGITPAQNRRLHKLLIETGLMAWKADYCIKYSFGRTPHSSELSITEAQGVIDAIVRVKDGKEVAINHVDYDLSSPVPPAKVNNINPNPSKKREASTDYEKANKLRRTVISRFITMGAVTEEGKSDVPFIDKVLERKWKKKLNDLSIAELRKLIGVIDTKLMPWYYEKKKENPDFTIKQ